MSISSIECTYISDDFLHQLKNGDPNLKLANPVPVLRFLYELVWSMVFLCSFLFVFLCLVLESRRDSIPGLGYILVHLVDYIRQFTIYAFWILQVHATLPFQKCKAALDAVEFSVAVSEEELGSYFADIVTQMALDVSGLFPLFLFRTSMDIWDEKCFHLNFWWYIQELE